LLASAEKFCSGYTRSIRRAFGGHCAGGSTLFFSGGLDFVVKFGNSLIFQSEIGKVKLEN
jgi:hypothetical protein